MVDCEDSTISDRNDRYKSKSKDLHNGLVDEFLFITMFLESNAESGKDREL
jgi:hypothetical protein